MTTAGRIAQHAFLAAVTAFVLLPVLWIVFVGFKPLNEAVGYPPTFLPRKPTVQNFSYVLTRYGDVKRYYRNSLIVSATVVPVVTAMTTLAGFAFARLRFPGRDRIFWALVVTIFFPLAFSRLFSIFELTSALGLHDTLLGLILPYLSIGVVLYAFIMRGYFLEIPKELEDAARIDGCSILRMFGTVMLPLVRDGVAVVAVLAFVQVWGEFLYAVTLTLEHARTLPVGLSLLVETTAGETAFNILAAAYTLAILPPVVLFVLSQRILLRGLSSGGLKF